MKKILVLTAVLSFFIGSNIFASSQMTTKEEKTINAIQKAAAKDNWTQYTPLANNDRKTLYFNKKIKNKDYYTYRYQNRNTNKQMTVSVKVDYTQNGVNVEFVDKISMNPGRLGIDNKVGNVLDEFADLIQNEMSANI